MNKEIFNEGHIVFDKEATSREAAFRKIAAAAFEKGFVASAEDYYQGLVAREQEATTGFKDGIAIPHCKNKTVFKPGVFLMKFEQPIEWNALDKKPIHAAFALTIPEEGATDHLKLLSLIARKLIDDDFRNGILNETDPAKLTEIMNQISY
ncbi:PTS sugar transporter subunit IIA [Isobaculum melis]|uniref:PTS system D-fructose-specific IIA component (F1P-forming), Frc family n=1 Tax=Isobaculum melis TaxID=142588 RepID=A0A1H9SB41_9LACT|nr:fructose PTS transporter subunit IIA [Isobaculum melis]SER82256.1 PTS system D-fructose-specific IIA component (F1P-forming), Frc family [Isobaculum melis]